MSNNQKNQLPVGTRIVLETERHRIYRVQDIKDVKPPRARTRRVRHYKIADDRWVTAEEIATAWH